MSRGVSDAGAFVGAYERRERSQPVEEGGFYVRTVGGIGIKTYCRYLLVREYFDE